MYLWVHGQWEHIDGVLLESEQHVGTVKVFDSYSWGDDHVPDISVVKTPQFWDMNIDQERMVKVDVKKNKICTNTTKKNVLQKGTVQKGNIRTSSGQVQIISSKRVVQINEARGTNVPSNDSPYRTNQTRCDTKGQATNDERDRTSEENSSGSGNT